MIPIQNSPAPRQNFITTGWEFLSSIPITLTITVAACLLLGVPTWVEALQFDRAKIAEGEIWRVISGHLTHWDGNHLAWDVLMFALLGAICERQMRGRFLVCLFIGAVSIPLAIGLCLPGITTYRGLSGLDTGLFTLLTGRLLTDGWQRRDWQFLAVLLLLNAGLLAKIGYELVSGATLFVDSAAKFIPLPLSHIMGACSGVLAALVRGWSPRPSTSPERSPGGSQLNGLL